MSRYGRVKNRIRAHQSYPPIKIGMGIALVRSDRLAPTTGC